jgi:hypothetical protein
MSDMESELHIDSESDCGETEDQAWGLGICLGVMFWLVFDSFLMGLGLGLAFACAQQSSCSDCESE